MINKDRLRLGIEALRSGEFVQGKGSLKQATYELDGEPAGWEHCCLGVLTEVALRNGLVDENVWSSGDLSLSVADWYDFGGQIDPLLSFGNRRINASTANDTEGYNFKEIADAFEKLIEDD